MVRRAVETQTTVYWTMSGDGSNPVEPRETEAIWQVLFPIANALDAATAVAGLLSRLDIFLALLLTSVLIPNRPRHHRRQPRIVVYDPRPG
jgi:hypothetical protein